MINNEKFLWIIFILICLAVMIIPAIYLDWSIGTTLSVWSIGFILLFIRG